MQGTIKLYKQLGLHLIEENQLMLRKLAWEIQDDVKQYRILAVIRATSIISASPCFGLT